MIALLDDLASGKSVDEGARISIAIGLYAGKTVSSARAAELAGLCLGAFIDIPSAYIFSSSSGLHLKGSSITNTMKVVFGCVPDIISGKGYAWYRTFLKLSY